VLAPGDSPAGFLRTLVVFHESEALGAGRSILHALDPLRGYGWTASAWLPGEGPLLDEIEGSISMGAYRSKPIRYSARGWRADPGVLVRLRDAPAYLRAFRRALVRARPHVVHANTLRALPEARVARTLGLPVVVHVHELPASGVKTTLALRTAAKTADVLVAVSEAVAEVMRTCAGKTPVLVAYNGVPPYNGHRRPSSPATVGSIGTICRTKGTDVFIEAAALARQTCPDLRFEHIGQSGLDEDEEFARRISALAGSSAVGDVIRLLGRRPANDGLDHWEMLVLPSRQDAFPLTSLEAMAAGVPVIAARVGGIAEQIDHLETGILVEEGSPRAFADWIVRLHRDPDLRARLARAAASRVGDRFTVERQGATMHKAYLAALNLRHGPPPVRTRMREVV